MGRVLSAFWLYRLLLFSFRFHEATLTPTLSHPREREVFLLPDNGKTGRLM